MHVKVVFPIGLAGLVLLWLLIRQFYDPTDPTANKPALTPGSASATAIALDSGSASPVIWSLGVEDGTADEFSDYLLGAKEVQPSVAADGNGAPGQTDFWETVPKGLHGVQRPSLQVNYRLADVPRYGVMLSLRILDADRSTPQLAVFSNSMLTGIIQIAGVAGSGSPYPYQKTYELYIPKEQLQSGDNRLTLQTIRCFTCSAKEDPSLWWIWDSLKLESLQAPAAEPVHGRVVYSGTTVSNQSFYYDQGAVNHLPYVLKWLGIAYSGNIMRTGCATDVKNACSNIKEYYETLRDYNTQAVSFHLYTGSVKLKPDGSLSDDAAAKMKDYLSKYGSLFQYYEIDNEPGLFNRSKAVDLALANWINRNKQIYAPQLQTVAPGWAYWPDYATRSCKNQTGGVNRCGDPDGWEADPVQRLELERVTDLTNGHSYGDSYGVGVGGSFPENLKTFGGSSDGLPKLMLNTEYGTSDSHTDAAQYGSSQRKGAAFDRIMRAHIGYADLFIQHAAFFPEFSLFKNGFNLERQNPALTAIFYNGQEQESRVRIMRRLNLAYATHGAPLSYEVRNREALANKLVYIRAVDTSSLSPLPVSGGESDKILVNLVNFGQTKETVEVAVTMPRPGIYTGERFGSGDTYEAARTYVAGMQANPAITFSETLQPGEAVQYILEPKNWALVEAPSGVTALNQAGGAIRLDWLEAEGAAGYDVLRSPAGKETYVPVAQAVEQTHYQDRSAVAGLAYDYKIQATGTTLASPALTVASTKLIALDHSLWRGSANKTNSNPAGAFDYTMRTRWDTGEFQTPGQFFQIDLGRTERLEKLVLDSGESSTDYPRGYEVYLSADGQNWGQPVAQGKGSAVTTVSFPQQECRYIKIVQTGTIRNFWSIHELELYATQ